MTEFTKEEQDALYEAHASYVKAIQGLKLRGVTNPERVLRELAQEIDAKIEVVNESVDVLTKSDRFGDYFSYGEKAGASIEEIKEAYESRDSNFLIESSFYNSVSQRINSLKQMGHKVRDVSVTSRGGIPHAEFITIDKDSNRKRHIIHGNATTTANLGKVNQNDPDMRDEGV